jgi:hypothetical protein
MLKRVRESYGFSAVAGKSMKTFGERLPFSKENPVDAYTDAIDAVLLQIISAAGYLVKSPDIIRLESIITAEVP